LHWWHVDSFSFPCSVLTLRFTSEFQELWESGLDTQAIIMVIRGTMGITHTVITGPIHTERTTMVDLLITGTTGTVTIATIAIIIITATKLTY
jgi:hypothetical protein